MNKSIKKESNVMSGVGPGGFKCACCNPFAGCTKKQGKAKMNRLFRRIGKQTLTCDETCDALRKVQNFYDSEFGKDE